ncbi:helix-turn-helix transcriptional regulator [Neobacillus drentensis]|uniref:helix-turn-helix domain-containing protein n=1 Tax=Neobacillus drentensis TaxID=220684 RepID=UPI002FFD5A46
MEELSRKIGERIREIRIKKGFTQEELAHQAFLHDRYIGKIERGEKNLSLESLLKITKVLDVTLGEFFNMVDPKIEISNNVLFELIDLLKDRSLEEQSDILSITKTFTKMLDRKYSKT